jgi:hypothetical protein
LALCGLLVSEAARSGAVAGLVLVRSVVSSVTAPPEALEAAIWARRGKRRGSEVASLCPAHDDKHPSASWNPTKQVWTCHSCGKCGGWTDLANRLGVREQAQRRGITVEDLALDKALPPAVLRRFGVEANGSGVLMCRP